MLNLFVFCIVLSPVVLGGSVLWRDLGSSYKVEDARVTDCNNKGCSIQKAREYTIELDLTATSDTDKLPFKITGSKLGFTIPLLEDDLCHDLVRGTCPIRKGDRVLYQKVVKTPGILPSIGGTIKARVYNSSKQQILVSMAVDVQIGASNRNSSFTFFNKFPFG